jgi:hypothetical protein
VTIVATTYFPPGEDGKLREVTARAAFASWRQNLIYDGELRLHVADDGSADAGWPAAAALAPKAPWVDPLAPVTTSRQERQGVGASLNAGCDLAFAAGNIVLHAVDDWELQQDFDLTPWVDLLVADPNVCMVRLGPPHPWLTGTIENFPEGWGMRLDRHHFAFGHRPALYHPRMFEAYGRFAEDVNAYECERLYNEHFCVTPGPDIVLALPTPWVPLESVELAGIDPRAAAR